MRRSDPRGLGVVVVAAAFFAAATVMARLAYAAGADPPIVVALRFVVGAAVLWVVVAIGRRRARLRRNDALWMVAMGAVSVVVGLLFFAAVQRLGAGPGTLTLYAHPALVAGVAAVLRWERFGPLKAVALLVGLGGVALVVGTPAGGIDAVGVLLGLGAAVALAVYVLQAKRAGEGVEPVVAGAWVLSSAAVVFVPPAVAGGLLDLGQTAAAWGWLAGLGAATGAAFALFLKAVSLLGPSRASIGASAEPLLAVVFGALLLGERLSAIQLVGGTLVIAAVALLPMVESRSVALGEAPPLGEG
ncbi:MAG TPA: DMT family transporter [Actinomycetota bacterium]|nr:DMT family transporter [Actinomycetota bacterium]